MRALAEPSSDILGAMRTVGDDAKSTGGVVMRGVLRLAVFVTLGVVALSFVTGDEPLGNRVFLWVLAAIAFVVAGWGLLETCLELSRVRRRRQRQSP